MSTPARSQPSDLHPCLVALPVEVVRLLGPTVDEAAVSLQRLALVELFRRGEVSSEYAADVLGMSRWEFIRLLADQEIPYVDRTEEELRQELEVAKSSWPKADTPPSRSAVRS